MVGERIRLWFSFSFSSTATNYLFHFSPLTVSVCLSPLFFGLDRAFFLSLSLSFIYMMASLRNKEKC